MLATPTTLHCRVVDIFKQQQRQVPCSERAQQLLTGNWQRSDVARPMLRIRNALYQ